MLLVNTWHAVLMATACSSPLLKSTACPWSSELPTLSNGTLRRVAPRVVKVMLVGRDMTEKVALPINVTSSLQRALEKQEAEAQEALGALRGKLESAGLIINWAGAESTEIKQGQACTHNACKGTYESPASDEEDCHHHPGAPVFHEGCGQGYPS